MATKLNKLDCYVGGGNISRPDCDFDPGVEIGGLAGPRLFRFPAAALASEEAFRAALIAASVADAFADRIFAVGVYQDQASTGEARQEQTFASGLKRLTRNATSQDDMTIVDAKCYHTAVSSTLHNKQGRFGYMKVLEQGGGKYAVVGLKTGNAANPLGFFPLSTLYVSNYVYPTNSTVGTFTITRGFASASQVDNDYAVMLLDFNPLDVITGLQTVELSGSSTGPTNVTVSGAIGCGASSLADLFGADMAKIAAFNVTNADPLSTNLGHAVTITAVSQSGDNYVLTLAATGVDPDNPGSGKNVAVSTVAPSALAALTPAVEGIESNSVTITLG